MMHEEVDLRKEYEKIKDQPMFFADGRFNHRLAELSVYVGLMDGISGRTKTKKKAKQNNVKHPWKRKKKRT